MLVDLKEYRLAKRLVRELRGATMLLVAQEAELRVYEKYAAVKDVLAHMVISRMLLQDELSRQFKIMGKNSFGRRERERERE